MSIKNMGKLKISVVFTMLIYSLLILTGCKKLVDPGPPVTSITGSDVYSSDATTIAVLTGMYTQLSNNSGIASIVTGSASISLFAGLSADEFTLYSGVSTTDPKAYYYMNALSLTSGSNNGSNPGNEIWLSLYNKYIFTCNSVLEGLADPNANKLTPAVRQQITGEAKFMRAFFYFYLVNFYGDVPLVLSTDYKANALLARSPKDKVYQQIITDLQDAQKLLVDGYAKSDAVSLYGIGTEERVRPNKAATNALLARVYLYLSTPDYVNAEAQATSVINNTAYYGLASLDNVFLKNSKEAIWQLQPVITGRNTEEAFTYIIPSTGPTASYPAQLSPMLLGSFEAGDQRRVLGKWVNSFTNTSGTYYYPYKYKSATLNAPVTEYFMMLRLGEQYLIRAEARAQQGNLAGAQSDLNAIRSRAGLPNTTASTQSALLTAILHEKQVELFSEWGHRWLDMKRTGTADAVMPSVTSQKGGSWDNAWKLYPLPMYDLLNDPNLVQNPKY